MVLNNLPRRVRRDPFLSLSGQESGSLPSVRGGAALLAGIKIILFFYL
jgi:hypothetical protein